MANLLKKHDNAVHHLTGLLVSMGIIFSLLPGTLAESAETGTSATEAVTQTRLENGSFEYPTVQDKDLVSGWCVQTKDYLDGRAKDDDQKEFYWNTTAYGDSIGKGKFELGFPKKYSEYGVSGAADGDQFAELCAQDQSSLYQNLSTDPGTVFNWSLSHAARNSGENNNTESMALFIGAKQESPLYKKRKGTGNNNDIFMWMAQLLKDTGKINISTNTTQEGMIPLTVYSQPDINVQKTNITTKNYTDYFSLTKTDTISKEWKCWIITTKKTSGWVKRVGTYEIPEGQTETTFAFTALTGKSNGENFINEGNLLDGVTFEMQFPLRVTTTVGGKGRVYSAFNPNDPDSDSNQLVIDGELVTAEDAEMGWTAHDHFQRYNDGTALTVRATPKEGYTFIGAYIDGAFHRASDTAYFTPINTTDNMNSHGTTYYENIIMDKARYIQLVYAKDFTVIFDPNGGTYQGSTANTEIGMSGEHFEYTSEAAQSGSPDIRFIGWFIGPFPSYYSNGTVSECMGALIKDKVEINYIYDTMQFNTVYNYTYGDTDNQYRKETAAKDGLTFSAQWEYKQTAKAMTMETTATAYENNTNGGTVQITTLQGQAFGTENVIIQPVETRDNNDQVVENGGGKISEGYARINDTVTMTAVPNPSGDYVFRGWYENGELVSTSTTYSYHLGKGVRNIEACFRAVLQYPYLSFVSQEEQPKTSEVPFKDGTSLKVGDNTVEGYGGIGQEVYGNTISTGFSTVQTFNNIAYDRCLWTITIPAVPERKPLYIKSAAQPTQLSVTEILQNDHAIYNPGAIYKVNEQGKQDILLRADLPTITGEGQAVFAVIIDNIYAPGAYATLDLMSPSATPVPGAYALNEDSSYTYNASETYNYQYYPDKKGTNSSPQDID